jgi:hypothetical protein
LPVSVRGAIPSASIGVAFLSDCRLSGQRPDGSYAVSREDGQKLFSLGNWAVAAYAGNRFSASFAIRRLYDLFRAHPRLPHSSKRMVIEALVRGRSQGVRFAERERKLGRIDASRTSGAFRRAGGIR